MIVVACRGSESALARECSIRREGGSLMNGSGLRSAPSARRDVKNDAVLPSVMRIHRSHYYKSSSRGDLIICQVPVSGGNF